MNERRYHDEQDQSTHYDFEQPVARLLASTLDPNRPNLGRDLTQALDEGRTIDQHLLPENNELVRQTEYLFDIEPSQFASFAQPYVEAITNEAEAQRADGQRVRVDVQLGLDQIIVAGNGKGMDFQRHFIGQVIRPHSGDEGKLRGQFGQGTLSYWMASESVQITSVPEDPNARGFNVDLRNNSQDRNKGKTVAGSLLPTNESQHSGTQVTFNRPHFNGKPLEREHLQRIIEYINDAVKNIYYAEVHLHLDNQEYFVNQAAIEAERIQVGELEILLMQSKTDLTGPEQPPATHIDVVGETMWTNQADEQQSSIVLNLPRQVMKAEARSLKHIELRQKDGEAILNFLQDIQQQVPEVGKRAFVLASLAEATKVLPIDKESNTAIQAELVTQLSECLQEERFPLFITGPGSKTIVFPPGVLLLPEDIMRKLPPELVTPAFERVKGFTSSVQMFVAPFRPEYQQEFFLRVGNVCCVNERLFSAVDLANNYQVETSVLSALNTGLRLYNLAHPAEAEQIRGNFYNMSVGEVDSSSSFPSSTKVDQPRPTFSQVVQESEQHSFQEFDLQPLGTILEPIYPERAKQEVLAEVISDADTAQWQSYLEKYFKYSRLNVGSKVRELLSGAEYDLKQYPDREPRPDISETQLLETAELFLGTEEERAQISDWATHLDEEKILELIDISSQEVFGPFLLFFEQQHTDEAQALRSMLDVVDTQFDGTAWKSDADDWIYQLLIDSPWVHNRHTRNDEDERYSAVGLSTSERKYKFSQVFRQSWQQFVEQHSQEANQVRFNILIKKTSYQLDGAIARRKMLRESPHIQNRFATAVEKHRNGRRSSKEKEFFSLSKSDKHNHITISSEVIEGMVHDQEYVYCVYDIIARENEQYTGTSPETYLDTAIHIVAYAQKKAGITPQELWTAHLNCSRLGVKSFVQRCIESSSRSYGGTGIRATKEEIFVLQTLKVDYPQVKLQILKSVIDGLSEEHSISDNWKMDERKSLLASACSILLVNDMPVEEMQEKAAVLLRSYQETGFFQDSSDRQKSGTEILFWLQREPALFSRFSSLMEKYPQLPLLVGEVITEYHLNIVNNQQDRETHTKVSHILLVVELILEKVPQGVNLENVGFRSKGNGSKELVIETNNERTVIDFDRSLAWLILQNEHLDEQEWKTPQGAECIEGDVELLQATYLGLKAEGKSIREVSFDDVVQRTQEYSTSLDQNQRGMYRRRLLSSVQAQDADQRRFYREWFQNSQNANADKPNFEKVAIEHSGFTTDLRRFTKVVDFVGMTPETAIWNLGTSPGFKEGAANQGSLERFHTGWLTSLNGASEVRVKTSIGNGIVTYRQFTPIYQEGTDGQQKLIRVEHKTWVEQDENATFGFTEMTRFEQPGLEGYNSYYSDRRQSHTIAQHHRDSDLKMYELRTATSFYKKNTLTIDYTIENLRHLKEQTQRLQESQDKGKSSDRRSSDFLLDTIESANALVQRGDWGVDVLPSQSSEHKLVQGGFPIGEQLPAELTTVIPETILNAFHEAKFSFILRIPPDVRLNKARDSVNDVEGFVERSRSEIIGVLIEGLAKALATKKVDQKMLLAYDTSDEFVRNYKINTPRQQEALKKIQAGDFSKLEWILESSNPTSELVRLAFNLPIFGLPEGLPGVQPGQENQKYSIMELMIIRAGAAYLLKYEVSAEKDPTELLQQLYVVNQTTGELELSREALARMAWLSRSSTQAINRLRQAQFASQEAASSVFKKLAEKSRLFNMLYSRVASTERTEKTAAQKPEQPSIEENATAVTDQEIHDLFTGKGGGRTELDNALAAVRTLEQERGKNVSQMKTVKEKAKPKDGEKAYFAAVDFTVRLINTLYPDAGFNRARVGFYQEEKIESAARGGGKGIGFNISPEYASKAIPTLLYYALRENNMSVLISDEVMRVIGHEGVHNAEGNWDPDSKNEGTTHDLRFRRDEYENFRRASFWLLEKGETGQPRIQELWQEYVANYAEENFVGGEDFYDRLTQTL